MTMLGVNLNEVVEKPRLPAGQPFQFGFVSAETLMGKNPNKTTGQIEPYIKCKLSPLEPEWQDRVIYHNWSLSPGALSADSALISIKKFFTVVGFQWNADGTFSTEDMLTIRFVGTLKYTDGKNFPELDSVLRAG